jgi:hypothetical protein
MRRSGFRKSALRAAAAACIHTATKNSDLRYSDGGVDVACVMGSCENSATNMERICNAADDSLSVRSGECMRVSATWHDREDADVSTLIVTSCNADCVSHSRGAKRAWCRVWRGCTEKFFAAQYARRRQKIARIISLQGGNLGSKFYPPKATASDHQINAKDSST